MSLVFYKMYYLVDTFCKENKKTIMKIQRIIFARINERKKNCYRY